VSPPPAEAVEKFTAGEPIAVDVGRIERDLSELWRTASHGDGDAVVTRACAWNLVYTLPGHDVVDRARERVDALVRRVPSRVLLVCPGDSHPGPLTAWVSARCRRYGPRAVVCSEEITMGFHPDERRRVPALLRALLVPDVPTAWVAHAGSPLDDPLAPELVDQIDRLVVDSDRAGDAPGPFFDGLVRWVEGGRIADVGWLRVAGLLVLFADLFDGGGGERSGEAVAALGQARKIQVTTDARGLATGWLVGAWLIHRLGFEVAARESDRAWILARTDGGSVHLHIDPTDTAAAPGLSELVIETPGGSASLIRKEDSVELSALGRGRREVPRRPRSYDELLARALTSSQSVALLQEILPVARRLGG